MKTKDVIKELNDLIQLDVDAIHAYEQALGQIRDSSISSRLEEFRDDHRRHIDDLSREVRSLGGTPADSSRDFKGFMIEGFTAMRSMTGTEGALKAMKSNEKTTNKHYEKALSVEMPASVRDVVEKNRADERRHLEFIENALQAEVWKHAG